MIKKLISTGAILCTTLFVANAYASDCEIYKIDPYHAQTNITVDHHNLSRLTLSFTHTEGEMCINEKQPEKSTVNAKIYMKTIIYLPYKGFTKHLKSSDYFNVNEFPLATFKSNKVVRTGKMTLDVHGTLNLMGKDKEYVIHTTIRGWGSHKGVRGFSYVGKFKMNRKDWGLTKYMNSTDDPNVEVVLNGEALLPVFFEKHNPNKPIKHNYILK